MDELSVVLNSLDIRGQIVHTFLDHLCNADDLCLISLLSAGTHNYLGYDKKSF